jgi:S1-C subfamily serine protease
MQRPSTKPWICLCPALFFFATFASIVAQRPQQEAQICDFRGSTNLAKSCVVAVETYCKSNQRCVKNVNIGFFVTDDGDVLTSLLGIAGQSKIMVRLSNNRVSSAIVKAVDQFLGLALLDTEFESTSYLFPEIQQIPAPGTHVVIAFLDDAFYQNGEIKLKPAFISSVDESLWVMGTFLQKLVQFKTRCPKGGAVAPILDTSSQLRGILIATRKIPGEGYCSYGVPNIQLRSKLEELIAGKSRKMSWLGVAIKGTGEAKGGGVRVEDVLPDTPAARGGVEAGDILLAIDKHPVQNPYEFFTHVVNTEPGTTHFLKILRDGKLRSLQVQMETRPLLLIRRCAPDLAVANE